MTSHGGATSSHIVRLVGVYDADSTLRGELAYWVGARLGRRHCSLCEITHGSVRRRPEWKTRVADLPVPFDTYHRDDQPDSVRQAADSACPVVVAETELGMVLLLSPSDIDACNGSIERLIDAIGVAAIEQGVVWGTA